MLQFEHQLILWVNGAPEEAVHFTLLYMKSEVLSGSSKFEREHQTKRQVKTGRLRMTGQALSTGL